MKTTIKCNACKGTGQRELPIAYEALLATLARQGPVTVRKAIGEGIEDLPALNSSFRVVSFRLRRLWELGFLDREKIEGSNAYRYSLKTT